MTKPNQVAKEKLDTTDSELLNTIINSTAEIAAQKKILDTAKAEFLSRRKLEIEKLLKEKDEPYGVVKIIVGNHEIKIDVPKKVEWKQDRLGQLWDEMKEDGIDPSSYIKIKYDISETVYKGWAPDLKAEFKSARTVKPGTPTIKFQEEE